MVPDPALTPELIQARTFTTGFRGYDHTEVRDFLNRVAAEVRALRERADQLESAWRSAEERAARPPVLDEETLMAAVGEETASILRTARAAAQDLRNKAAEESERAVSEAREDAERIRAEAESALADERKAVEEAAAGVLDSARAEARELLERARAEAEAIKAKAEQERALTVEGANSTRERILEDLSRRRRVATVQIEQLRAGRERLLEAYAVVRRTLEEAQEDLTRADAEARAAADEVGRRLQREQEEHQEADEAGPGSEATDQLAPEVAPPQAVGGVDTIGPAAPGEAPPAVEAPETVEADVTAEGLAADPTLDGGAAEEVATPNRPVTASRQSPVEELFARIRAGKDDSAPVALEKVLSEESRPVEMTDQLPAVAAVEEQPAVAAVEEQPAVEAVEEQPAFEAVEEQPAAEEDRLEAVSITDAPADGPGDLQPEAWLERREARLVDLETGLTRKLKRALQDEQNDLLDRLRGLRGEPTPEALLPDLDSHTARYIRASVPVLEEAATAGGAFAGEALGAPAANGSSAHAAPDVSDLAGDAATVIVAPLRRRLEHLITSSGGEEQSVLVESLGAAYREWKSHRIERVAGDVLAAAFSRGTWNATPDGASFRWIVEDADGPCPDCDDDALAGELPKGEPFPTGQPYPPAHSGCRCLLVPVNPVPANT